MHILYIDDDIVDLMAFRRTIQRFTSHTCSCVSSWDEARDRSLLDEAALCITDFHLPQENVTEILQSSPIPVIVTSGIEDEDTLKTIIEAGASGFMLKPIKATELEEAIKNLGLGIPDTNMIQFDWRYLQELSGGDLAFEQEMIQIYQEEVPKALVDIQTYLLAEDWQMLRESIHKLKSKTRIVGLNKLGELAHSLEKAFKSGEVSAKELTQTRELVAHMKQSLHAIAGLKKLPSHN